MPAIDRSYGFYQIAKYNYYPGWHQQSTSNEILVNMDKWNALSDAQKTDAGNRLPGQRRRHDRRR